ncbi:hypothetical protein EVAR_8418_1 [Eumeta japonica]|uniref:Uncharacterized protein n=1 Tax=Eumeta variegata TaxID=151549 RepID=A0A4C1WD30_EUMVA|nr:hypothetical protein EVAR_8418_1 [Eumeta japonica]
MFQPCDLAEDHMSRRVLKRVYEVRPLTPWRSCMTPRFPNQFALPVHARCGKEIEFVTYPGTLCGVRYGDRDGILADHLLGLCLYYL